VRRDVGFLVVVGLLIGMLTGCGGTPEPTVPPPSQTPWIVIVTSTPIPEQAPSAQPTPVSETAAAAPTRARQPTPTPTAEAVSEASATVEFLQPSPTWTTEMVMTATPTTTVESMELLYPSPVLLEPPPDMAVTWGSRILFQWTSVGELGADDFYVVEFYRPPKPGMDGYGDSFFVKETEYLWEEAAKDPFHPPEVQGTVVVDWWVRVVRKIGEDDNGKPIGVDISLPSDRWTVILDPKPEGQ
jgi:hypothetical protein